MNSSSEPVSLCGFSELRRVQESRHTGGSPSLLRLQTSLGLLKKQHRQTQLPKNGQKLGLKTKPRPNSPKMLPVSMCRRKTVGYLVRLLDDKLPRIRFRRSEAAPNGFEAEWRVANRNFAIPEVCRLRNCVARVATYFAAPHQVITLTSEAESWHLSYQGAMNVQSHLVRDARILANSGHG